jgi:predicted  nucleic acid-binding Zn-ribbon protein
MPHRCVRCGTVYDDGASEILKGCSCGARLFFFIKKKHLEESKEVVVNLSQEEKKQMEHDVLELVGAKQEEDKPVILDFESVRVLKPGQYLLDLVNLFKKDQPLVFKLSDGKYIIDIPGTFRKFAK